MEDNNQPKNQTKSEEAENVVELSAEMALKDQAKHKIIDLTDDIDSPEKQTESTPKSESPKPLPTEPASMDNDTTEAEETVAEDTPSKETLSDEIELEETFTIEPETDAAIIDSADLPQEEIADDPADIFDDYEDNVDDTTSSDLSLDEIPDEIDIEIDNKEVNLQKPIPVEATDSIEDEVDAAFDAVAVQAEEPDGADMDDLLFDELSDITQEVDEAAGDTDAAEPAFDEDDLAAQAADLDDALSGGDDTFEPSGGTGDLPGDLTGDLIDEQMDEEDDEIIELVDIVDPSEMESSTDDSTEDNEIIELTHVVTPEEITAQKTEENRADDFSESAEMTDPLADLIPEDYLGQDKDEEELSLSAMEDDVASLDELDEYPATDDAFDPAELENLFGEDEPSEEETAVALEPLAEDVELPEDNIDIESIPELEDTEGLFDIVDQFSDAQMPKEDAYEAVELTQEETTPLPSEEETREEQDQVIHLTDIISTPGQTELDSEEDPKDKPADEQPQAAAEALAEEIADDMADGGVLVEDKKIEAAVEHIIHTKYADKIEQLIANAVEEAVTREIENIKRTLSDTDESSA